MAALEAAMQECAQFTDQLDGMLNALQNTADQVNNAEPISAHPEKIKEQMEDNNAIIDDLAKKETAFEAVKKAADEIIQKAPNKNDPAIKDIKKKLDKLNGLWGQIQKATGTRSNDLEQALALAEKFWNELQNVMDNLKQIQDNLNSQEPPGVEPKVIEAQKAELKNIKKGIDSTKPIVDKCKQTGKELMSKVGDSEKPEVKRHIEDLDNAWDNVTSMFHKVCTYFYSFCPKDSKDVDELLWRSSMILWTIEFSSPFFKIWENSSNISKNFRPLKLASLSVEQSCLGRKSKIQIFATCCRIFTMIQ